MEMEDTGRTEGIRTGAKEATYVEAVRRGGHRWWRYLVGLVVILFSWLIVGSAASVLVAFALGGRADPSVLGPVSEFLFIMVGFPFFLAGILIAVSLIHRRHPRTLVTAREKLSWRRVGHGFVAWFVLWGLIGGLGQYLLYPDTFSFNSDLATFALFVPLALVFIAIQTTTEELFFRGYIVQGTSLIWANRVFLALVSAVIFTLPHLANPEAQVGGWLFVFSVYFVGTGLVWVVVSLVDGTTELAIGAHFANNIAAILVVTTTQSVMTTPALFTVSEYHATFNALAVLVIIPLFLVIVLRLFRRKGASEPVSQSHRKVRRRSHKFVKP